MPPTPEPPTPEPSATTREPEHVAPAPPPVAGDGTTAVPVAAPAAPSSARPGPQPDAAAPVAGVEEHRDRWLPAAGVLAIAGAALQVAGLIPTYQYGETLSTRQPFAVWYVLVVAAGCLAAGVCVLHPRTRRAVGPGLLLGLAAASTWGLLYGSAYGLGETGLELGYWLGLAADLVLVLAACLAGVALVQASGVRLVLRLPDGPLPWLVALLGAAGAVALLAYCQQVYRQLGGTEGGAELAPSVWAALVAPVVPVGAALLAPRRFGVAVLLGWIGGGTAIFLSSYSVYRTFRGEGSDIDGRPILAYGLTLLALLVVTGLLARVAQTSRAEPAAGG